MQNIISPQHEFLKSAMEATDSYLGIEKQAVQQGFSNSSINAVFLHHIKKAHDALNELGVFADHKEYLISHIQKMIDLTPETKGQTATFDIRQPVAPAIKGAAHKMSEKVNKIIPFGQYIKEEEKKNNEEDTISKEEIDQLVDELTWEDIVDLYDEAELVYEKDDEEDENEPELEEAFLDEKLTVQSRLKKRQAFARMRGKRNAARNIKLRRASSIEILKKRATLAGRRAVYKRFLRGRDKSTLSAAEKDRVEQQVSRMKYMQTAIATKMLPKMRSIEQKRLAGYRTKKSSAPRGTASKAPGGTKSSKRR